MENTDIISKLNVQAPTLTEEDLDQWVVPQLLEFYRPKINGLATKVYGRDMAGLSRAAFAESARECIRNALNTFFFRKEHWKGGRSVNTYLLLSLKRLATQRYYDMASAKKQTILTCPACREETGDKVFLFAEDNKQRCRACTSESERLQYEIKKMDPRSSLTQQLSQRMRLHRAFAIHSRHGFKCLDCKRFIPENLVQGDVVACPYLRCSYFGETEELAVMAHPAGQVMRQTISLDATKEPRGGSSLGDSSGTRTLGDLIPDDCIMPEEKIAITQQFEREHKVLTMVIDQQIAMVRRMNASGTFMQKLMMYEAFRRMLHGSPEEMVSYLVHQKQNREFPIQSRIFQEYLRCMEEVLPFSLEKHGEKIDVISINDPVLDIFDGKSEFDAIISESMSIPNNTVETYTGLREFKDHGNCLIGKLLDIQDKSTGDSLMSKVTMYSFVNIFLKDVDPGTEVTVTHYRIPAHYEMKSMVYLQRIRKHIVEKVDVRLNGVKHNLNDLRESA